MACPDCAREAESQLQAARDLIRDTQDWIHDGDTLAGTDVQYTALQLQLDAIMNVAELIGQDLTRLRAGRMLPAAAT